MAFEVLNLAFKAPITPANKKFLLVAMADYASTDGTGIWASAHRLAQKTSLSKRWVRELRRQLRDEDKLIIMTRPATPTRPADYSIDLDALRHLIDREELSSPPELNSPQPLNSVPKPPEPSAPKPPREPPREPPRDEVVDQIDAEVQRIIDEKHRRGEPINNLSAFEAAVRSNVEPKVIERIETQKGIAAGLDAITSCGLCNNSGIVAWESESGTPLSERCTHDPTDYDRMNVITQHEAIHR